MALSDNRYKLYRGSEEGAWELYDLLDDPAESRDLAKDKPDIVKSMSTYLLDWKASCQASDKGDDY